MGWALHYSAAAIEKKALDCTGNEWCELLSEATRTPSSFWLMVKMISIQQVVASSNSARKMII
jgi:hypothetical protein